VHVGAVPLEVQEGGVESAQPILSHASIFA
jgi:hypothetical protein